MRHTILALSLLAATQPAQAEEVNLYSYRQPELLAPLTDAFTKKTGIEVNVAYLSDGMVERLQAEGDRSPADLVFTVDVARLAAIVDAGVTQPVTSDLLQSNVPAQYHDPEGNWWGLTTRARIVYASKDRVDPSEVTTYEDLADPKWRGRLCTRSGTHPYNVALAAAHLYHHGADETRTWLEGLKANLARKPQGNDRAQVKAIWSGECDIALGNTYYMGQMLADDEQKEWADAVNVLFPVFEGGGTHENISGVAMTKAAPNRDNALKMMEFLTTPEAQEIYAHANYEYPIAPGSQADELVRSWGSFDADPVNLMELADHRAEALRLIEDVDFDG
ncbi:iron ABC transporter substrate-binding protein [Salipiger aestuarii]|uniref:Fe(3+) ABC transporter substrate-binding protein n=1 Tax=Salipiger aestuarii TaxID=568098 RepID=UPI00025B637E|nr:Fe(3+) ABC transporter substrate-binding protein [Salipiger aestuarii]EIE52958.1 Extracellular solute-binding protein, family 1 precursor [Citreicella sp. 357]KAA8606314.1 iron ABC transporter substrate-binding protein [Salipiger aestuarii]KAA8610243.1 iron ABC transporter substrate-binding protein [Salipiger aestuarii]